MKFENFAFIILCLSTIFLVGGLLHFGSNAVESQQEASCYLGLAKAMVSIHEDLERLGEYKLLCPSLECKTGIQIKIDLKENHFKAVAESDFCERYK